MFNFFACLSFVFGLAFILRVLAVPSALRGCDAYYYLLCAEEFRKRKKIQ